MDNSLRALAVEIQKAIQIMTNDLNPDLKIALAQETHHKKKEEIKNENPLLVLLQHQRVCTFC